MKRPTTTKQLKQPQRRQSHNAAKSLKSHAKTHRIYAYIVNIIYWRVFACVRVCNARNYIYQSSCKTLLRNTLCAATHTPQHETPNTQMRTTAAVVDFVAQRGIGPD